MHRIELPRQAKVLLRLPNWLGDVVLASPALLALSRERPDLELVALVKPGALPAVEGFPGIASVRALSGTGPGDLWREAGALRREGFHAALIFPKGFREALLVCLAGISVRAGLATDRRSLLLTHPVPFTRGDWERHHALQFAKVLEPLGVALRGETPLFPVGESDRREAARVMGEHGLEPGRFAAFHITGSKAPRAWHAERFAAVARRLRSDAGLGAVLVGGPSDADTHAVFRAHCPEAVDLAGGLSVRGAAALFERSALFVGSDSGPMHIAAAVGAKVVAVFGPGSPQKTAPPVPPERIRFVYSGFPCSPCRQAFFKDCAPSPAGKPPCIEAVAVDTVLAACLDLLGGAGKPGDF
jgi:heptosyltransferase-2